MKSIGDRTGNVDWSTQIRERPDWSTKAPGPKGDPNLEKAKQLSKSVRMGPGLAPRQDTHEPGPAGHEKLIGTQTYRVPTAKAPAGLGLYALRASLREDG